MPNFLPFKIRNFTPKDLYTRSILLVVFPLFVSLLSITYIFLDSHSRHTSRKLSQATAAVLAEKIEQLEGADSEEERLIFNSAKDKLNLALSWQASSHLPYAKPNIFWSSNDEVLTHELNVHLKKPIWIDIYQNEHVTILVDMGDRLLQVIADRDRVFSSRRYEFIGWAMLAVLIITALTLGFLRNHVKSVLKLSEVAQAIGRGQNIGDYRPFGATEVRLAAKAILEMQKRVTSFNKQRTEMLAGVSHDLRTPITRIRLSLATQTDLSPESQLVQEIEQDLEDMSRMLEGYLTFAKDAQSEPNQPVEIDKFVHEICALFEVPFSLESDQPSDYLECQPLNLRRAIINLIENGRNYAETVNVSMRVRPKSVKIIVDDDGPGIAPEDYEAAFQPFNRLDPARNLNTNGTGLGLAIARDIARAHGGDVILSKSPMGGLRAMLVLPK